MRRHAPEQPYAQAATWTRRLAVGAAILAVTAVGLAQRGVGGSDAALAVLACAVSLAAFACLAGLSAFAVIWRTGHRGIGRTVAGLVLAGLTLAYPGYLAATLAVEPAHRDLATDPIDPPRFSLSTKARDSRAGFGDLPYRAADAKTTTADVEPVVLDMTGPEAAAAVSRAVRALRWHVVETVPASRSGVGHVDATTYSPVMRLPEEIAIRIKPQTDQTRIDIRSTSRLGLPDFGDNARNIKALSEALEALDDER